MNEDAEEIIDITPSTPSTSAETPAAPNQELDIIVIPMEQLEAIRHKEYEIRVDVIECCDTPNELSPPAQPEKELDLVVIDKAVLQARHQYEVKAEIIETTAQTDDPAPKAATAPAEPAKIHTPENEPQELKAAPEGVTNKEVKAMVLSEDIEFRRLKKEKNSFRADNITFSSLNDVQKQRLLKHTAKELESWLEAYSEIPQPVKVVNGGLEIGDPNEVGIRLFFTAAPTSVLSAYFSSMKIMRIDPAGELAKRWTNSSGIDMRTVITQCIKLLNEAAGLHIVDDHMLSKLQKIGGVTIAKDQKIVP